MPTETIAVILVLGPCDSRATRSDLLVEAHLLCTLASAASCSLLRVMPVTRASASLASDSPARPSRSRCPSTSWPGEMRSFAAIWRFLARCASGQVDDSPGKVRAGVLPVRVKEQVVDVRRNVVVVRGVARGAADRVILAEPARGVAHPVENARAARGSCARCS